ncbi:MAG: DUF721 domain-containing protein [Chitinophagia bacterium]|nr:DUF721 domain-containing protein [Chitinophagia bacterium]
MAEYNIGDAVDRLFEGMHWNARMYSIRMAKEWQQIVGSTIAKYTYNISLCNQVLTITTDVAALKHELRAGKEHLIKNINDYFKNKVVTDIVITDIAVKPKEPHSNLLRNG